VTIAWLLAYTKKMTKDEDFTHIMNDAMKATDPSQHMTPAEYSLASFMLIVAVIDTTSNSL
jgi:cytochrome P450